MSADARGAATIPATSGGAPVGPLLVPAIGLGAIAWANVAAVFPSVPVLVGAAVGCLVLVLNSPAWALAPLLITELSLFNYSIEGLGLSLRLALVLVGAALTLKTVAGGARLGDPRFRRVALPAIAFVLAATLINLLFSDSDYVLKYFRYQLAQLLSLVLAACLIRDRRDVRRVVGVALGFGVASAVAAVWQHYDPSAAPYGMADVYWLQGWRGRSLGLSDGPVTLANNMTFVLLPLLGLVVAGVLPRGGARKLVYGAIVATVAGMYVTYTRSALMATGAGLVVMAFYLHGNRRKLLLGALLALFLVYEVALSRGLLGARYSKNANNDRSAASHDALLTVALAVAADNFVLGIGHQHFEEVSAEYRDVVEGTTGERGVVAIGSERPHNDFLGVIISWGGAAFAAYMLVMLGALRNFAVAARSQDGLVRGLAIGCAGGLATYAANSAFHNYLDSSSALWMYAGFSVALARLPTPARLAGRHRPPFARLADRRRPPDGRLADRDPTPSGRAPDRDPAPGARRPVGRLGRRYAMGWS